MKYFTLILLLFICSNEAAANFKITRRVASSNFVKYDTFDENLVKEVEQLLKKYRSDYSSVVVINNDTSEVLVAMDYIRDDKKITQSLAFSSTHPAASLFKIVTASALLDTAGVNENEAVSFSGRANTLYKYQLRDRTDRWARLQRFDEAFASSNNVIFGKMAINSLSAFELYHMAQNFHFNSPLSKTVELGVSKMIMPGSEYHLAELASGLNTEVFISPVRGALLAQAVASGGKMDMPKFSKNEKALEPQRVVFSAGTAKKLEHFMNMTITHGTAKKSFRKFNQKYDSYVQVGGKTGTITGGEPFGRRDWFTAYMRPKNEKVKIPSISICVMNINVKKWYVKSSFLAENILTSFLNSQAIK